MHHVKIKDIYLKSGGNGSISNKRMCIMEAVSYYADEPFSMSPKCVNPVLLNAGWTLNDNLPDEERQTLKTLIPRLVETAGGGKRLQTLLARIALTEYVRWEVSRNNRQELRHLLPAPGALITKRQAERLGGLGSWMAGNDWRTTMWGSTSWADDVIYNVLQAYFNEKETARAIRLFRRLVKVAKAGGLEAA